MDLELTDEQRWLSESIDTLLHREWPAPEALSDVTLADRQRVWDELRSFGALSIGGEEGVRAVEACLIARALGSHLTSVPFIASASVRLALAPADTPPLLDDRAGLALAILEPGSDFSRLAAATTVDPTGSDYAVTGEKVAVEQVDLADRLVVTGTHEGEVALALVPSDAPDIALAARGSFDETLPMHAAQFDAAPVAADAVLTGQRAEAALERLGAAGALLAAAEAIGAAERILEAACRYAAERRQFGRSIASFQALRHMLADMYLRTASGLSTVLYAAAAFDENTDDADATASIAKAYVARGARDVAHGAMQVFGGIAFTEEHPAHRYLRRIIVREQQFGDAAHHERKLGRALAQRHARSAAGVPEAVVG